MIHAVILAGGSGTRFWPATRHSRPKQFLPIAGQKTMLEQTVERVLPLCGWERVLLVASKQHAGPIRKLLPELPRRNLLVEPRPRNTAPAIGLAASEVLERDPDGVLAVLPADHVIRPPGRFRSLIRAAAAAADHGGLITLGVHPSRPETGYGYIQAGRRLRRAGRFELYAVESFTEKPDRPRAVEYLQSGDYYWNSGMFVFTAEALLQAMAQHMPAFHRGLARLRRTARRERPALLKRLFERVPSISVDYAVMEKAGNIQMLPCELTWSDVGSWAALGEVIQADASANVCQGDVLALDSTGCVLRSSGRLVACVGLHEVVVVETPDAVLVCPLSEAQAVRRIVDTLQQSGRDEVL